jgi:FtsX-like permease family
VPSDSGTQRPSAAQPVAAVLAGRIITTLFSSIELASMWNASCGGNFVRAGFLNVQSLAGPARRIEDASKGSWLCGHWHRGIRLAIGAQPRHILRLALGQGLGVIAVGIGIGLMSALVATGAMSGMLLAVNPRDPLIYTLVSLFLCCVALLACFMPAHRAMRTDPLVALRHD